MATNYRPTTIEPIHRFPTLQDGGIAHVTIPTPAGGLYGQDRPKGRKFNSPSSQRFTTISGLPRPRGNPVSVQSATIRTLHCSLHVQKTNKTTSPVPSQSWNPDTHLPGRHALKCTVKATTSGTSFHSHLAVGIAGFRNQCAEVSPDSIETNRLLRIHNRYQHNDQITTSSEESRDTEGDITATQMSLHTNTDTCMSVGETCFHINLLELKAAYLALQCFLKETLSTHVLMRLDKRTAIAYLNRMGGPSYPPLPAGDRHMELVPCMPDYTPCRVPTWYREYQGRLGVEAPSRQQQLGTMPISIRGIELPNGTALHRSVCVQNQLSITGLLQLET